MIVEIFSIVKDQEHILPLFIDTYKNLGDIVIFNIYNNRSTDNSIDICIENNCNIYDVNFSDKLNEFVYDEMNHKNNVWKESTADWVIVCDPDELAQINIEELRNETADVIKLKGYQMLRYNNKSSFDELICGYRDGQYDKSLIFKPTISEIDFTIGSHYVNPISKNDIKYNDKEYKLLHYKRDRMDGSGKFNTPTEVIKGLPDHPYPFLVTERGIWITDPTSPFYELGWDELLANELDLFFKEEKVNRIADFGSGNGDFINYFNSKDYDADGYDGNPNVSCNLIDLSEPIIFDKKYDWIISFEVGEHIPSKYEDVFIKNLHDNNIKGIILTWALPNQLSVGHVNCQENCYIKDKFLKLGYKNDLTTEKKLRKACKNTWLKESLMVFKKK